MIKLLGIPQKNPNPSFSWRPIIVLSLIFIAAGGVQLYGWITDRNTPPAVIESVGWNEISSETLEEPVVPEIDQSALEERIVDYVADTIGNSEVPVVSPPVVKPAEDGGLPSTFNLAVPFASQAPLKIWDAFTEETCEEASLLMVRSYYNGLPEGSLDPIAIDGYLRAMVRIEDELGFGVSISTQQFTTFAQAYDGTVVRTIENPSVDDLRALIAAGHPILVPAFGRRLHNPFFTGEGPLYHMLVLRGYTPTTFIANDPGTRHGESYQYPIEVLMQAIGDWDGDSPDGGVRVMVFDE